MDDEYYMGLALEEAEKAAALDEVPIGAVVVYAPVDPATRRPLAEPRVIARAGNRREILKDPSAHAEFSAMLEAAHVLGAWRLTGCTVYVTLEPCIMCAGLMHQARIDRCVYGAADKKAGALGSLYQINEDSRLNHTFQHTAGVCGEESARLLSEFFSRKRKKGSRRNVCGEEGTGNAEPADAGQAHAEGAGASSGAEGAGAGAESHGENDEAYRARMRKLQAKVSMMQPLGEASPKMLPPQEKQKERRMLQSTQGMSQPMQAEQPTKASQPTQALHAIRLCSPAKVNLYLEIGARRTDGYHDAVSILHALDLSDSIIMQHQPTEKGGLQLAITVESAAGIPPLDIPVEDNLMYKAVHRLAKALGRTENERIVLDVQKRIPFQAGLGGGSSNAAAALVGAALLWGLDPGDARLEQTARTLGADVPFFLRGACDCLLGVGDEHDHELVPMEGPVCLIKPKGGVSTAAAYRAFDESPEHISEADRAQALAAFRAKDVPLRNNLFAAAKKIQPQIEQLEMWVDSLRAVSAGEGPGAALPGLGALLVSGSGSAVFVCCENDAVAGALQKRALARGYWAQATRFSPHGIEWERLA